MMTVPSVVFSLGFVFDWCLYQVGRMLRFVWQIRDLEFGMSSLHQGLLNLCLLIRYCPHRLVECSCFPNFSFSCILMCMRTDVRSCMNMQVSF